MIDKLEEVERKFDRLTADLSNPDVIGDSTRLTRVMKERSSIEKLVETYRSYKRVVDDLTTLESDPEMLREMRDELPKLKGQRDELEAQLKLLLLPKDPNDEKNVIVEIRAGAGGDEAGLFGEEVLQ